MRLLRWLFRRGDAAGSLASGLGAEELEAWCQRAGALGAAGDHAASLAAFTGLVAELDAPGTPPALRGAYRTRAVLGEAAAELGLGRPASARALLDAVRVEARSSPWLDAEYAHTYGEALAALGGVHGMRHHLRRAIEAFLRRREVGRAAQDARLLLSALRERDAWELLLEDSRWLLGLPALVGDEAVTTTTARMAEAFALSGLGRLDELPAAVDSAGALVRLLPAADPRREVWSAFAGRCSTGTS